MSSWFPRAAKKKPPPAHGIKMKKAGTTWWGQQWIAALGKTKEEMGMPGPSMALSFATTLVMAAALAMIIVRMPPMSAVGAMRFGSAVGIGIVAMGMASDYAFTNWPRKLYWIQASYHVVMVVIMSLILGLWR